MSKRTLRRRLVAVVLAAGVSAALLARIFPPGDTPRALGSSPSTIGANPPIEAATTEPNSLSASTDDTHRANIELDGSIDAALGDFERAFSTAPEEELDLIAAAHLADIVRQDAHKVARFIELQPPSQQRDVLIRHLSRIWGESDVEGALAWAEALPDARENNLARRAACISLSRTNPAAALERCVEYAADGEGEADLQGMFQAWAQSEPASANAWLDAQPLSARLDRLRQRYVHVLAKTDPQQALRMTQERFTAPAARDEAVLTVLHQWGLQDPRAARDWVENHAADELKVRALAEIEGLETYAADR